MSNKEATADAEAFAQNVINTARTIFKTEGSLAGLALIPTNEGMAAFSLDSFTEQFGGETGKNLFSMTVRRFIAEGGPEIDRVALIVETWVAELSNLPEDKDVNDHIAEMYETYGESMEDWPEEMRSEQIMLSVETRDGTQIGLFVPIDKETRELGEPTRIPAGATGRFTNWFGGPPTPGYVQTTEEE